MSELLTYEEEKELHNQLLARQQALAEFERQEAYRAVAAALLTYRWWGITNIINTIRLWLQGFRG